MTRARSRAVRATVVLAAVLAPAVGASAQEVRDSAAAGRDAVLRDARTLAWAGRLAEACTRYDAWLRERPDDVEAQLARARTLAWAHRYTEAAAYAGVRRGGGAAAREAAKGEAQLTAWRGDLAAAAAEWRTLAAAAPQDAEVWVGLGQTLRWAGDPVGADRALRRAEALAPGQPDAGAQRRWLRPELEGTAGPTASYLTDSDGNRNVLTRFAVDLPAMGRASASLQASRLDAALGGLRSASTRVAGTVRVALGAGAAVAADVGTAYASGRTASGRALGAASVGALGVRGTVRGPGGSTFALGVARAPFDETAALAAAHVWSAGVAGGADLRLGRGLGAALSGEWAGVHGASGVNGRRSGAAEVHWRVPLAAAVDAAGEPGVAVDLFGGARAHGYARPAADGYFAPRATTVAEGGVRLRAGHALGWQWDAEAAAGRQRVAPWDAAADVRGAVRGAAGVAYRAAPGVQVGLRAAHTTAASPGLGTGGPAYQATSVGLDARVLLPRRLAPRRR